MGLHLFRWERRKHCRDVRRPGTKSKIQPLLSLQPIKDHRHTVVNTAQKSIRNGCNDCKTVEHVAFNIPPDIPKTGKGKRLFILQVKPDGNLAVSFSAPFIETICGNKTALFSTSRR
jgi:hypothetical protein